MAQFISTEIIRKYLAGNCTQQETDAVLEWFNSHQSYPEQLAGLSVEEQDLLREKLFERIMQNVTQAETAAVNNYPQANFADERTTGRVALLKPIYKWVSVAAAILIIVSATLYLFTSRKQQAPVLAKAQVKPNVIQAPAVTQFNKAVLTLANGKEVNLTDAQLGAVGHQGQTSVVKTNDGQVAYNSSANNGNAVTFNELTVPKGAKYEIVLADGTKVCLNAASKLRFPTTFEGSERNVELTGEAYFEVAKNPHKPFNVMVNGVKVQVLGTHFDISAYKEDNFVKTTLLEGSVKVIKNKTVKMLTPGNQATADDGSDDIAIAKANVENVVAWKNGFFIFEHENIAEIMKKVSRWYDVDVITKGAINTNQHFSGRFDRSKSIEELINYLEKLDAAHFNVEGRRIQMMN